MMLPVRMADRWLSRREDGRGQGTVYWHMLMRDQPDVISLAREGQRRLAPFAAGLHMTPLEWLHMTTLVAGPAGALTPDDLDQMAITAQQLLAGVAPIAVTVGRILYHPEAIMLAASPAEALMPIRNAAIEATRQVTAIDPGSAWTPHATICYSTADQAAQPLIGALGMMLPEREIRVCALNLVVQHGPERDWNWTIERTVNLSRPG